MEPNSTSTVTVLATLEERVRQAASELSRLRERNAALERRLAELEQQLREIHEGGEPGEMAVAWEAERDEVRRRVERLAQALEELLADDLDQVGVQASLEA
jgi:chromosome segregation ATPase